jgi:hypothetical protein
MYGAYVFSLVLGGGFLLLSVLGDILGGDASDMAFDADIDVDVDVDVHMDVDAQVDVDGDVAHHDMALVAKVFSFRMVVYTLFGFGAVGWLMTLAGLAPAAPLTVASSVVGGLVSGALVQSVFNYLKRTDTGSHASEATYVGRPAVVTLPLGGLSPGNIAVELDARRLTLRALPHEDVPDEVMKTWKNVVIVDMKDGVARVTPVDEDLQALTDGE